MNSPHADVAELADAQVSEACDGDIVEVQVLSSAPIFPANASPFEGLVFSFQYFGNLTPSRAYKKSLDVFRASR